MQRYALSSYGNDNSNNNSWQLRQQGTQVWLGAQVPGVVQQDLLRHGLVPDPYIGTNETALQWVEDEDWEYRYELLVSPAMLQREHLDLVFEGLDTYATVRLNGTVVLEANNMFRTWRVPIKDKVKEGANTLELTFHNTIDKGMALIAEQGYQLPAGNDARKAQPVSPFVRKAPYQYGWDWGPRIVTTGIWRPVHLEAWDALRITGTQVLTDTLTDEVAQLRLLLSYEASQPGEYAFAVNGTPVVQQLRAGTGTVVLPYTIQQPKRWWPAGMGTPHLYTLDYTVQSQYAEGPIATGQVKAGLRTVRLLREQDAIGEGFAFEINGVPTFMKGANYIPQDLLLPRVTKAHYDALLEDAAAANMNMIRVWGGGIYESDYFYQRCDELGLMVWQDFMFACSMYPGDAAFLDNVEAELRDNVRRLRNHPSLVHWNGNNEVHVAWGNWGWQLQYRKKRRKAIEKAYAALFQELIPGVLAEEDGTRPYTHTSPLSNWGKAKNFDTGSMHYWGVWHGPDGFEGYSKYVGRFMSEYGFQSFPPMATLKAFAPDPASWHLRSAVMRHHQKSYIGNRLMVDIAKLYYPEPSDFAEFVYQSQLTQAKGIGMAIESHRKARNQRCMGTLYWQLNDCWPGPSWSSRDWYGRWKALHYTVREAYAPQLLVLERGADSLRVHCVNDAVGADTALHVVDLVYYRLADNSVRAGKRWKGQVNPASSQNVMAFGLNVLAPDDATTTYALATWKREGDTLARKALLAASEQLMAWPSDTQVKVNRVEALAPGQWALSLSSNRLAMGVQLALEGGGPAVRWQQNYLTLLPGHAQQVVVNGVPEAWDEAMLRKALAVRWVGK